MPIVYAEYNGHRAHYSLAELFTKIERGDIPGASAPQINERGWITVQVTKEKAEEVRKTLNDLLNGPPVSIHDQFRPQPARAASNWRG